MVAIGRFLHMAKTVQSRKAKGRNFQKEIVQAILETFPELTENDVRSTSMGNSGTDIQLSEKAIQLFPFDVECKNCEKLAIWQALEQTESRSKDKNPILFFKRNRSPSYAVIRKELFFELVKRYLQQGSKEISQDDMLTM